ncbi:MULTISPECIES: hypothetical protein [unclassified Polaribacter]|uniref:hypothetical protein n=1 Tax=unclassified Polaribacter TaxID=196858 RepID=UPI0011BF1FB3|nr:MULTISPECIES: hypothetical protein [unclassified Polaribacter]TXD53519.1 hypothetical protein ES043_03805 [Polaribacter sp. IC063]TXD58333.1 hypothetical protein ES044_12395 [Polaribacter sp. IC066]
MHKNLLQPLKKIIAFTLLLSVYQTTVSQASFKEKNINTVYNAYTKPFQEVIYTHLNKSNFIKGEFIGFTTYAFNKKKKRFLIIL